MGVSTAIEFDRWYPQSEWVFQRAEVTTRSATLVLRLRRNSRVEAYRVTGDGRLKTLVIYAEPTSSSNAIDLIRGNRFVSRLSYPNAFRAPTTNTEFRFSVSGSGQSPSARGEFRGRSDVTPTPTPTPTPEPEPEPVAIISPGLPWREARALAKAGIPIRIPAWSVNKRLVYVAGLGTTRAVAVIDDVTVTALAQTPTRRVVLAADFGRAEYEALWVEA